MNKMNKMTEKEMSLVEKYILDLDECVRSFESDFSAYIIEDNPLTLKFLRMISVLEGIYQEYILDYLIKVNNDYVGEFVPRSEIGPDLGLIRECYQDILLDNFFDNFSEVVVMEEINDKILILAQNVLSIKYGDLYFVSLRSFLSAVSGRKVNELLKEIKEEK